MYVLHPDVCSVYKRIVAYWRHMMTDIWVKINPDKFLLPDGINQLLEAMLTWDI